MNGLELNLGLLSARLELRDDFFLLLKQRFLFLVQQQLLGLRLLQELSLVRFDGLPERGDLALELQLLDFEVVAEAAELLLQLLELLVLLIDEEGLFQEDGADVLIFLDLVGELLVEVLNDGTLFDFVPAELVFQLFLVLQLIEVLVLRFDDFVLQFDLALAQLVLEVLDLVLELLVLERVLHAHVVVLSGKLVEVVLDLIFLRQKLHVRALVVLLLFRLLFVENDLGVLNILHQLSLLLLQLDDIVLLDFNLLLQNLHIDLRLLFDLLDLVLELDLFLLHQVVILNLLPVLLSNLLDVILELLLLLLLLLLQSVQLDFLVLPDLCLLVQLHRQVLDLPELLLRLHVQLVQHVPDLDQIPHRVLDVVAKVEPQVAHFLLQVLKHLKQLCAAIQAKVGRDVNYFYLR